MVVRIGTSPISWTNDDLPELGRGTPLEVCLRDAREAGFVGVELGHKFPRDPGALREVLERHDLLLVSGWYGSRLLERSVEDEIRALEPHLSLLSLLGSDVLVFAEVARSIHGERLIPLSKRPILDRGEWAAFGAALTRIAAHTRSRGIDLAYHHHVGTVIESGSDIERLMECTGPDVRLLLDTGHAAFAGEDAAALVALHGARIAHVHLKDVRGRVLSRARDSDLSFLDAVLEGVFTVPGDGAIDFERFFRALRDVRYDRWLIVEAEQDPAAADPMTYAKMGYLNTASLASGCGLFRSPAFHC